MCSQAVPLCIMDIGKPRISSLTVSRTVVDVIFNCTSTESPATRVTWLRDGVEIQDDVYNVMEQHLIDRRLSTYDNLLIIPSTRIVNARYSCNVSNTIGSAMAHIEISKLLTNHQLYLIIYIIMFPCSSITADAISQCQHVNE